MNRITRGRRAQRPQVILGVGRPAEGTQKRYLKSLARFCYFIQWWSPEDTLQKLIVANAARALAVWVSLLMQVGFDTQLYGLGDAGTLFSALKWRLLCAVREGHVDFDVVSSMRPHWNAYRHWGLVEPTEYRAPISLRVMLAMAGVVVISKQLLLALFLVLSFHCLLRVQEAKALRWGDISVSEGLPGVCRIRKPKMPAPRAQHVLIECEIVAVFCAMMRKLVSGRDDDLVFPFSELELHRKWTMVLRILHIKCDFSSWETRVKTHLAPGGLRPGGATHDYLRHQNLMRLQWRGRWGSAATLHHYVQLGVYYLNDRHWPLQAQELITEYSSQMAVFLRALIN